MSQIIDLPLLRRLAKPALGPNSDKDDRGRVLVIGGGPDVPGAVLLTAIAALRAGAGKLQIVATPDLAPGLGLAAPEARIIRIPASADGEFAEEGDDQLVDHAARCDAVIVGPGMMDQTAARRLTRRLLEGQGEARFVVDAAALTGLEASEARAAAGRLILTPHAGEMAALCGHSKEEVQARPLDIARDIAADYQSVVVMKGRDTHVVSPDGRAWHHVGGVPGLGVSGSGDVLAGIVGGLLARGFSPIDAAILGVYLHGRAGERLSREIGPLGFLARELLDVIPAVLADVTSA